MDDHGLGREAIGGLHVYGGLTVFAAYQLLLWFGVRERQALHLAAAAIFIALTHALSGDLAGVALPGGLGAWRAQLFAAMPLLALGALVSLARGDLGGVARSGRITRALRATTLAALVGAATAPLWRAREAAPWLVSAIALAAFVVITAAGMRVERGIRKRPRHSRLIALALLTLAAALALRPHRLGIAETWPESALELVTLAALLVLGYAVASRGQLARRERRMADLRHYIGQVMAADVAARATRDVQLTMARRAQDLAGFALAGEGTVALEGRVNELAARNELLEREVRLRREAEGRIRAMAYQNPLTRLPNRGLLGDRFAVATAQARRHGQKRCADQALYAAKADGRGTYRYFSEIRVA